MKKHLFVAFAVCTTLIWNCALAQTPEVELGYAPIFFHGTSITHFDGGGTGQDVLIENEIPTSNELSGTLGGGFHYPFLKFQDDFTVGAYGGVDLFLAIDNSFGGGEDATGLSIPLFCEVRYGSFASADADDDYGIGFGLGGMMTTFKSDLGGVDGAGTWVKPAFEVNFGYDDVILRFRTSFSSFKTYYQTYTGQLPKLTYTQFYLTFGVLFGK